ncbi:hypothetical protein [Streptomyces iconiensis]|uniref:Uncharacterized protein n=1 Tax=Streptomyces iconiensis TaxID=1384038 RepID=A0ABT6ZNV9_9ACTN|nr:hypothetical protein [Streptomyces iconiensis]MDJ1130744.1 hypothetical protein [Streptomyces iconiensis]
MENGTAKAGSVKNAGAKGGAAAKSAASDAAATAEETASSVGVTAKDKLVSAGSKAGTAATVGLTVVKERQKIVACAGGGLLVLLAGAFALGRRTAGPGRTGPLTRLTNGRI